MAYVDGFVAAAPTASKALYAGQATEAARVYREQGALELVECRGDDVPDGELTSFPVAVRCKAGETTVCSWIVWPSRQARDRCMHKVMADPRMRPDSRPAPFDARRMIYGGFEMIVEA